MPIEKETEAIKKNIQKRMELLEANFEIINFLQKNRHLKFLRRRN